MINLPTTEETTRTYKIGEHVLNIELLELDELHKSAADIAKKDNRDFYEVFNTLFKQAKQITLSKAAIFLILTKKAEDFKELKKRLLISDYSLEGMEYPPTSQEET